MARVKSSWFNTGNLALNLREFLEDFEDFRDAHAAYLTSCAEQRHFTMGLATRLATGLQESVERLNVGLQRGHVLTGLDRNWQADAYVFVGDAGSALSTQRIGDRIAVLIDLDLVLRLVLLIFLIGLDIDDDEVSDALSAFLVAVYRRSASGRIPEPS